jgi:uncharacterized protein with HEPN domain
MPLDVRDLTRLNDMLHHARLAREMLGARALDGLKADTMAQLAVVRCVEVIGEAGSKVSSAVQLAMPTIPWHRMTAMRNRLIHDYGNTDLRIVHDVVSADLPVLVAAIENYLAAQK